MVGVWKTCFLLLFFDGSDALLLGARNKISTLAIGMFDWSWTDNLERNECMFSLFSILRVVLKRKNIFGISVQNKWGMLGYNLDETFTP